MASDSKDEETWIQQADKNIQNFLCLMAEKSWTEVKNSDVDEHGNTDEFSRVTIKKKTDSNESLFVFRGEGKIKADIKNLVALLFDPKRRTEWDLACKECYILKEISENIQLAYMSYQSPLPLVADRDFVFIRCNKRESEKRTIICTTSVESLLMPVRDRYIRADSKISGWIVDQLEETKEGQLVCKVSCALQMDPKGWIPNILTNTLGPKKAIDSFQALRRAVASSSENTNKNEN